MSTQELRSAIIGLLGFAAAEEQATAHGQPARRGRQRA